ncbi:MAG TPA: ABC transporter substrate-binding protein [Candidatus Cybelea sp.]|nr:ABC transporter substrate-binding protein [Candidatus Cybelea sp.]
MKRTWSRRTAAISGATILLIAGAAAPGARRPRYGGTLVVEIGAAVNSTDATVPSGDAQEASAREQIDRLIFDHPSAEGRVASPGPFRMAEWEPGKRAVLAANEQYPGGRPFVDAIEIQMARTAKDRLIDLELGRADVAEIPVAEARRAAEQGVRVSQSQPDELIALVFVDGRPPAANRRMREAVADSIDRDTIVNFILQKEGEPAGGLLPGWSSGTAFLFPTAPDPARAKELWSQIPHSPSLALGYDSDDPLAEAIAERIAVNARDAGISMTAQSTRNAQTEGRVDGRIVRLPMTSSAPQPALASFLALLHRIAGLDPGGALPDSAVPQQIYEQESAVVHGLAVVPIAWVPHTFGLGPRVRDWTAPGPGQGWPLADVWLDDTGPEPPKGSS